MRKLIWRRPSAGVVLGTLALIVAVAGNSGAFAGTKVIVRKGQIAKGAVTAKALAAGAVHPAAISNGAVGVAALRAGSVGSGTLGPDAVTSGAIAPGSVYGGALGEVSVHSAALVDADVDPSNNEWTASAPVTSMCGSVNGSCPAASCSPIQAIGKSGRSSPSRSSTEAGTGGSGRSRRTQVARRKPKFRRYA